MRFFPKWVLATLFFMVLGAFASVLVYLVTGLPVFGADLLDYRVMADGMEAPLSADWSDFIEFTGSAALGFAVVRSPEALMFGLAWAIFSRRKPAVLVAGAIVLPLAFEVMCGLFPLSANWVGDLAASLYYYPRTPEYLLPLRYTARVALSFLGPPLLASLLSLALLSRIEKRVLRDRGKGTA